MPALVSLLLVAALAGEEAAGRGATLYRTRCAVCHPTGTRGGQAPGLGGIVGRKAGAGVGFAYSRALATSGLTWDAATLDRFLAAPTAVVPGSKMVIATPSATERQDLIAYLATLKAIAEEPVPAPAVPSLFGDYRNDAPGAHHQVSLTDLPVPYATKSAHNGPNVVAKPKGVEPRLPEGFAASVFASGLDNPRLLRVAPNGDLFVAESSSGRIRLLRSPDGAPAALQDVIFAKDLDRPFGIAFYPPGADPRFVYIANTNSVVRFPYRNGDLQARGPREAIVGKLAGTTGGHWTRDLAFSPDGTRLFVSVGSQSNVADGLPSRSPETTAAWQAGRGLGAAWGDEESRADVLAFDPEGHGGRTFASGIRNCVGLVVHPRTGDLWCSTNERDGLGDDLVPDYVTRVREGAFYGWPWYYLGEHEDPRHAGERRDLRGHITVPDLLIAAHSASLQLAFYDGAMFPARYAGGAFVALHGSWNRSQRTGYKVAFIPLKDGVPAGGYDDFMTGFVVDDGHVWARPVGIAVAHDGALFVSEDGNGTIWRISYRAK